MTRQERLDYERARLSRDVTTAITWYMRERGITQDELAAIMGVSAGRVSQILNGDDSLTLREIAAVCVALDAHFEISLVPNMTPAE